MGFSTLLDILGATLIGGYLLMILLRMNGSSVENTYKNSSELIVQQNLVEVVKLLEYDFRKIGYCRNFNNIPDPSKAILYADHHRIRFETDVAEPPSYPYGDEEVDILDYYLGSTTEPAVSGTPNPDDRMLYRVLNDESPKGSNLGITSFHLNYFTSSGALIAQDPVVDRGAISVI